MPNPSEALTSVPTIKVNGAVLPRSAFLNLSDVRVRSSLLETSSAVLRFDDPIFELIDAEAFKIGDALEVSFLVESTSIKVFVGVVVALGADQRRGDRHEFVVEAMDKSYLLSSEATPKTYLKQSWSDIVKKIASVHGLTPQVDATTPQLDYVLQTVNDRLFLSRIAHSVGFEWFVDGNKLIFRKRPSPAAGVTLSWLTNLLRFEVRAGVTDMVRQVTVRGWDRNQSAEINGVAPANFDAGVVGSDAPFVNAAFTKGKSAAKNIELVPGAVLNSAEAKKVAEAVVAGTLSSVLRVSGEAVGDPKIAVGDWVQVADCGSKLSGKYYVTECEHVFGGEQNYRTRFRLSNERVVALTPPTAAGAVAGGFGHTGFVVGKVTNIDDKEASKQRVKVKYPSMPTLESEWARVVVLGGGPKTGVDMRPEVGDEVLIGFEHGDLRLPYVIGGLTSKADHEVLPAVKDNKVDVRSITSRAGHRIEMLDGSDKDKQHIKITTGDGKTIARFGQDMIEISTKAKDGLIFSDGKAKITMKDGKIVIDAETLDISTKQATTIDAKGKVDVTGSGGIALDGVGQAELKAAKISVAATGITEIKGGMVKIN